MPALGLILLGLAGGLSSACAPHAAAPGADRPASLPPLLAHAAEELALLAQSLARFAEARAQSGDMDPSLGARLSQAQGDVRWLERHVSSWQVSPAVNEFAAAITEQRRLLAGVPAAPIVETLPVIDAVLRDLQVKARQCRRFGGPVPVSVSVVTRDANNQEVTGYEVWFVRKAYEREAGAFRRFDRNSSPAGRVFQEAGYYVLWAERPSALGQRQRGTPLDVEVGAEQRDQVVDLMAPLATDERPAPISVEADPSTQ